MDRYYRGMRWDHIRSSVEEGFIRGSEIGEDERFDEMEVDISVYGKDKAVWVTDDVECAKTYGWGGGYFEIDPSELKVVEDRNSCYAVIMRESLSLDHVESISLEETNEPLDRLMKLASLLGEEHGDIELSVYQSETYDV